MPESYMDDYTMGLIAPTHPSPHVVGRWLAPTVAELQPEPETDADATETKVVKAPVRKRTPRPATKAETA